MALMLLAATQAAQSEPLAGDLRSAIWSDLQLNAMIGNGNWIASLWYNAGADNPDSPDLHLTDLECKSSKRLYTCSFSLIRDGGVKMAFNQEAPDKLSCHAVFVPEVDGEGWSVRHLPPSPQGGHSQTTMTCDRTG